MDHPADRPGPYTERVGLYGTDQAGMVRLIENTDCREHVRKAWTGQGEAEGPAT